MPSDQAYPETQYSPPGKPEASQIIAVLRLRTTRGIIRDSA